MKSLIQLQDYTQKDIDTLFTIADTLCIDKSKYNNFLLGKTVVMFFPESSIRTRITFEKGIHMLGGQVILFPPETLDKKEKIEDVIGYLNNWADILVIRHSNIDLLKEIQKYSKIPVINAMTSVNHPCEILSDLYALSKVRKTWKKDQYLFIGGKGNIGMAWQEARDVLGIHVTQCCPKGYEIPDMEVIYDINQAVLGKDIICTDPIPTSILHDFSNHQVTMKIMQKANPGALLNPCPPFYRGEEVSKEVIESDYFVGYNFKKHLLEIQQAILIYSLKTKKND
ncbi:MAG: ornithine carbamoyltransferase [Coprobacillaceae bacterium]